MSDDRNDKSDQAVQAELDAAQADLEAKVGQLKDVVKAKVDTPRKAIERVEDRVAWLRANPAIVLPIAFAAGALLALIRR